MDQRDVNYVIEAHRDYSVKPSKGFRKWNGETPYHIHPIWCATMLATETSLPNNIREEGVQALLYHDVLEDTTRPLPDWISPQVTSIIEQMTYKRGSAKTPKDIWQQEPEIRLYKLYDNVNNLLDAVWMDERKRREFQEKTIKIGTDVENNFGRINIVRIVRSIAEI